MAIEQSRKKTAGSTASGGKTTKKKRAKRSKRKTAQSGADTQAAGKAAERDRAKAGEADAPPAEAKGARSQAAATTAGKSDETGGADETTPKKARTTRGRRRKIAAKPTTAKAADEPGGGSGAAQAEPKEKATGATSRRHSRRKKAAKRAVEDEPPKAGAGTEVKPEPVTQPKAGAGHGATVKVEAEAPVPRPDGSSQPTPFGFGLFESESEPVPAPKAPVRPAVPEPAEAAAGSGPAPPAAKPDPRPRSDNGKQTGPRPGGESRQRSRSRGRRSGKDRQAGPSPDKPEREVRPDPEGTRPAERAATPPSKPEPGARFPKAKVGKPGDPARHREMVINVAGGDECRIAVLEEGRLEELYIERQSAESHVGSIYKGRITNVEPSIQAAFIDFGQPRNGFLHISDVHPQYFPDRKEMSEDVGKKIPRRDRPLIQRCFRRGQEVVVQVTKEGVGTKGPTLTTYLSIPGRFLVMMPGMSRVGVSRRIEDQAERRAMRDVLTQLPLPEGMGFILRTAGMGQNKRELQRDLNYLNRLWKIISDRIKGQRSPCELYQESDLVIRTIRDVLTSDFSRIVADDVRTAAKAQEFIKIALPRTSNLIELYDNHEPLFHRFGIEDEIEKINSRHVPLALGGSIVIDPTEAMVAIDVNSGRFRDVEDPEKAAYQINLQAAEEIARQLRLRDLGGLIVCDFIDMYQERHKREVERTLRNALKKHKERARILRMSQFGLIEMTRQRQRPSIKRSIYAECTHCRGSGLVKTTESMVLEVMRMLQLAAYQPGVRTVTVTVCPDAAFVVQNQRRARLHELEQATGTVLTIRGDQHFAADQITCECADERGRPVKPPC